IAVEPSSFNSLSAAMDQLLVEPLSQMFCSLMVLVRAALVIALLTDNGLPVRSNPPLLNATQGTSNPSMLFAFACWVRPLKINLSPFTGASPLCQFAPVDQLLSVPLPVQVCVTEASGPEINVTE